jgi:uncharacterized protein YneF (UPF0154 family)
LETVSGLTDGAEEPQPAQPIVRQSIIWAVVILAFVILIGVIVYFSSKSGQKALEHFPRFDQYFIRSRAQRRFID